jgi:hypothetical protein
MAGWTHVICLDCWKKRFPGRSAAVNAVDADGVEANAEPCCFCRCATSAGIFVREDPKSEAIKCGGTHGGGADAPWATWWKP